MLGRKVPDEKSLLCLDIGTAFIRAAVFQQEDDLLELKGYSTVPQQMGNIQGGSIIHLAQTIANVQEAVKKAENMARKSPKDVVVGLSGELVKGTTVNLQYLRNRPEKKIDAQELKSIIYELQWQAFDIVRKQISEEMCLPEMDLKLVNASIVSIRLDDSVVIDPRGMSGTKVEMEIFNCFAPVQHFGHIQTIAVELPYHELKGVFIQSFGVAHAMALNNSLESAIVIDIGAGTTDVCVMVDGKIIGNRSFAFGGNSLTKRISYELSMSFAEAESIKISYCEDELEKNSSKVIGDALQSDLDIWMSSLDFCLKELPMKRLPHKILLCGKVSRMKEFKEVLLHHDWEHHFPLDGETLEVHQLQYSDVFEGEENEKFDREFLPLLAVASTSYDLLYNNSSVEAILNSIIADKGV
ncbi:MAG: cell division FtsA domain-containing protein [Candidatus Altimarinota bacterium]